MSTLQRIPFAARNDYPSGDGKPMAETDWHRMLMHALIETLQAFFAANPRVYVSGNLLVFYEPGTRRKHVSPDVFVVRGVPKLIRENYLIWEEGKTPEVVFEITSRTTRREDMGKKMILYRDVLRVKEYFLFDPYAEYLDPPLQGLRLRHGAYRSIRPVAGRLPSQVLGLHLERNGSNLRLFNPATNALVPTVAERRDMALAAERAAEAEVERLRQENEALRRRLREGTNGGK